jgi:hypothetical protein
MRIKGEPNQSWDHSPVKKYIMDQEMEQRIWEYIDGHCSPAEKALISKNLAENPAWQSKYTELMGIHVLLQSEEPDMPSLRFTKNVMEEISRYQVAPATRNYINKNVIRGITAFFLVMIIGLLIYFVGQIRWSGNSSDSLLPKYNLDAGKLNWGKLLNNTYLNIFIGINVILGLILADKFMQEKKNTRQAGHWSKGDSA